MPRSPAFAVKTQDRKGLDHSIYSSIDSFLKPLKGTSRRLQVVSTVLANETQLLQRIFYKGKNQHRSALFWRRAAEIRRYSERLRDIDLADFVFRLRCSFFGEDALRNLNVLKGAWTLCPDVESLTRAQERCTEAQALLAKFQARTMDAYNSFSISIQTGAFIQILLVLAAITARMNSIAQEYEEIIGSLLQSIRQLKAALERTAVGEIYRAQPFTGASLQEIVQSPSKSTACSFMEELMIVDPPTVAKVEAMFPESQAPIEVVSSNEATKKKDRSLGMASTGNSTQRLAQKSHPPKEQKQKRPAKEKKRRRDEIDDIFGLF
ncbi:hypothetical protein D9611_004658 [Ephemerocybe angulata]|uniref:Nucleolus and neural progenitor protein-like N-terminal domain-containing protein n=1 Tax=Ephemerocybe angulata TaxID=980116 RepID=A0A8H5B465_9AGAR|nr:hypothetical protein D9611_004658 [Tulosesus angulatus]